MTQAEALSILKSGANVFLTGEPGAGKSHTINQYVAYLRAHDIDPAVTASTGIAATHIGGVTIHSWSGIGVRKVLSEGDLDMLCQNERLAKRVGGARVLIIDEVSMLSMQTLTLADQACRALRRSSKPFGGLQVVLVGDFFQLPPVVSWEEQRAAASRVSQEEFVFEQGTSLSSSQSQHAAPKPGSAPFAYHARAWNDLNPIPCYLHEQHRQEDARFLDVLSGVRSGEVTAEHRAQLQKRMNAPAPAGKTLQDITQLFSHNADVDRINDERLGAVAATGRVFQMRTRGAPTMIETLKRTCLSPETLTLKMGAKVMFTKNNGEQGYVNGTTGEVCGWREDGAPLVRVRSGEFIAAEETDWEMEADGRVVARVTQIPLRLAWAITVHKSQGMSLDEARIDLSKAFEYGQGYVALSRVRTLSGLFLLGLNERALQVHPDILTKDKEFREQSDRAEEAFGDMGADELKTLHTNFIRACGGKVEASTASESVGQSSVRGARLAPKSKAEPTWIKTLALVKEGNSIPDIAAQLDLTAGTIVKHLQDLKAKGTLHFSDLTHLADGNEEAIAEINDLIRELGDTPAKPVFDHFEGRHSYDLIRLARLVGEE